MSKTQTVTEYRVQVTEFSRATYRIRGCNPEDAIVMFDLQRETGCLPDPQRVLLGEILPPERGLDARGRTVYYNPPPADDAERLLFLEMWRRMREASPGEQLEASMRFICEIKNWPQEVFCG